MIYLASPYSHWNGTVMKTRFEQAAFVCGELMRREKTMVYSPIVHNHTISNVCNFPLDYAFWGDYDEEMLSKCKKLYVLKISGWKRSKGIEQEMKFWNDIGRSEIKFVKLEDF